MLLTSNRIIWLSTFLKKRKKFLEKKKVSRGCRAPPTVTTCNFRVLSFQYSLLSSGSQSFHSQQTFASQFSGYYLAHQSLELYSFNDRGKKLSWYIFIFIIEILRPLNDECRKLKSKNALKKHFFSIGKDAAFRKLKKLIDYLVW